MRIQNILVVLSTMLFIGCTNRLPLPKPVVIDDNTSCQTITLKFEQRLIINLASNPTTGYQWVLKRQPSGLRLVSTVYQQEPSKKGMMGAGGKSIWTFQAREKSSDSLVLVYEHSWEEKLPAKTFMCAITID